MNAYYLIKNLDGNDYQNFLNVVPDFCNAFKFIMRESTFNPIAKDFKLKLEQDIVDTKMVKTWPGTGRDLFDQKDFETKLKLPEVKQYNVRLSPSSVFVLKSGPSLFEWNGNGFFDDLSFYRKTGEVFMASTGHERIGAFFLEEKELDLLGFSSSLLVSETVFYRDYFTDEWASGKN